MNSNFCIIHPYGKCENILKLHSGRLFEVYRAELPGTGPVCLKIPRPAASENGSVDTSGDASGAQQPLESSCFEAWVNVGSEVFGHTSADARPGTLELTLLLQLEMETVRATGGLWNHSVIGMGSFESSSGALIEGDGWFGSAAGRKFWPVALTPYYRAKPLSGFLQEAKRALFPRMLPALWEALCLQPHGDLSEGNLLIDEDSGHFILIDPGVYMGSAGHGRSLFTTNAANYPVFFPHEYAYSGKWFEDKTLAEIAALSVFEAAALADSSPAGGAIAFNRNASVRRKRPTGADLQAIGLMYYRILSSGDELSRIFGPFPQPAWSGEFVTPSRHPFGVDYVSVSAAAIGSIDRALSRLQPGTAALVKALVFLEVKTRDGLEELLRFLP